MKSADIKNKLNKTGFKQLISPIELTPNKHKENAKRLNFTMLEEDVNRIKECHQRGRHFRMIRNNSEYIRAGIKALLALPDEQFADIVFSIPHLTKGNPR